MKPRLDLESFLVDVVTRYNPAARNINDATRGLRVDTWINNDASRAADKDNKVDPTLKTLVYISDTISTILLTIFQKDSIDL